MKRIISSLTLVFCLITLALSVLAQTKEAIKVQEINSYISCGYFNALMDVLYQGHLHKSPDTKLYVIFYGARYIKEGVWNKKTKTHAIRLLYPRRTDILNRAKEIPLYLETVYKFPNDRVVLVDGGFRENIEIEIWITHKGSEPPKPSPTIEEKNVKFRKGEAFVVRNCAKAYDMYQ